MKRYTYAVKIERERRKYYAYSEDFPGVYGLGKTIDGAKTSILEAMRIYIEECRANHRPIPRTSTDSADRLPNTLSRRH